ncbi:MAG TPA: hypothetical protein VMN60_08925 [Longimicrobiales bacterium]|nr:hypothetical protein [Longimicrobiales bacterium]
MAGKLSASSQVRLATLRDFNGRVSRAHGLVEQFATTKANPDQYLQPMQRLFGQLKLQFMGVGLDTLSQLCGSMETAAKRGLSAPQKARILREGVGSLKFQLELAQRSVVSEDEADKRKKAAGSAS